MKPLITSALILASLALAGNGAFAVVAYRRVIEIYCVVRASARNGHRVATECA